MKNETMLEFVSICMDETNSGLLNSDFFSKLSSD